MRVQFISEYFVWSEINLHIRLPARVIPEQIYDRADLAAQLILLVPVLPVCAHALSLKISPR